MKVSLSKEGPNVSNVIAGTMNWGTWGANFSSHEMADLINNCIEIGVTTFDHADIYGGYTTEADFGKAFKSSKIKRSEIELISKCGICYLSDNTPQYKIKHYNTSKDYILQSVENSLKNLQTEYLDILLIHRPSPIMNMEEIAEAFTLLKKEGKVKNFGVSNFKPSQIHLINSYFPIITNQIETSVLHKDPFFDGTLDTCQQLGIHPMIWSPLAGGKIFTDKENPITIRLSSLGKKYDWTMEEMAYLFLMHPSYKLIPVIGTSKFSRIKSAVEITQLTISNEQWFEILLAITDKKVP